MSNIIGFLQRVSYKLDQIEGNTRHRQAVNLAFWFNLVIQSKPNAIDQTPPLGLRPDMARMRMMGFSLGRSTGF